MSAKCRPPCSDPKNPPRPRLIHSLSMLLVVSARSSVRCFSQRSLVHSPGPRHQTIQVEGRHLKTLRNAGIFLRWVEQDIHSTNHLISFCDPRGVHVAGFWVETYCLRQPSLGKSQCCIQSCVDYCKFQTGSPGLTHFCQAEWFFMSETLSKWQPVVDAETVWKPGSLQVVPTVAEVGFAGLWRVGKVMDCEFAPRFHFAK